MSQTQEISPLTLDEVFTILKNSQVFTYGAEISKKTQLLRDLSIRRIYIVPLFKELFQSFVNFKASIDKVRNLVTVAHAVNLIWTKLQPPGSLTPLDSSPVSHGVTEIISQQFGGCKSLLYRETALRDNLDADETGIIKLLKQLENRFAIDFHDNYKTLTSSLFTVQDCIDLCQQYRNPS